MNNLSHDVGEVLLPCIFDLSVSFTIKDLIVIKLININCVNTEKTRHLICISNTALLPTFCSTPFYEKIDARIL